MFKYINSLSFIIFILGVSVSVEAAIVNLLNQLLYDFETRVLQQVPTASSVKFSCLANVCNGCTGVKIQELNFNQNACATLKLMSPNVNLVLKFGATVLYNKTFLTTQPTQQLCQSVNIGIANGNTCFNFNTTLASSNKLNVCASASIKLATVTQTKNLGCVTLF